VILAALLLSACPAAALLPDGDAYVRGLLDAQRAREEAVSRYSYDVSEVVEDLMRRAACASGARASSRSTS
jgi:hypothetical protein